MHVALLWVALLAAPADEGLDLERVAEAQVDWSARTLTAEGSARVPDPGASGKAALEGWRRAEAGARQAAEQRARVALTALRAHGATTLAALTQGDPAVAAALDHVLRAFHPASTRYHRDGRVDVSLTGPLGGEVLQALEAYVAVAAETPLAGDEGVTGVVVNARGIAAARALAPRLYDEEGVLLYGAGRVTAEARLRQGVVAYSRSLDRAVGDARVGGRPLIVKALRAVSPQSADLVIAASDAEHLRRLGAVLAEGRVGVVVD